MIAKIVYLLCALTSGACALALVRGFRRTKTRFLMWTSFGFAGLAISNLLLFLDLVVFPNIDMHLWRMVTAFVSVILFLGGLIWDTD